MNEIIRKVKYKGELDLAGYKIPCYVLEDGRRFLATAGMQDVLKMTDEDDKQKSGTRLGRYLSQKSLKPFVYKGKTPGHYDPTVLYDGNQKINGHEATRLVDFSDGMLEARKHIELSSRQKIIADQSEILVRVLAKVSIIALVDEATGYQKEREETLQEILRLYVSEEVLKWQKTFHDEFYGQILRLWGYPFTPESIKKKPKFIGYLTAKLVYENLPEGVVEKIKEKNPKTEKGRWRYHFHRLLTPEVGREHLKKVIYSVETLAKVSKDKNQFLRLMKKVYHPKKDLPYIDDETIEDKKPTVGTEFDEALKTLLNPPKKKSEKENK